MRSDSLRSASGSGAAAFSASLRSTSGVFEAEDARVVVRRADGDDADLEHVEFLDAEPSAGLLAGAALRDQVAEAEAERPALDEPPCLAAAVGALVDLALDDDLAVLDPHRAGVDAADDLFGVRPRERDELAERRPFLERVDHRLRFDDVLVAVERGVLMTASKTPSSVAVVAALRSRCSIPVLSGSY
jgi:hypothetical protein